MDVGIQMIFSTYGWPGMSDREAWQRGDPSGAAGR